MLFKPVKPYIYLSYNLTSKQDVIGFGFAPLIWIRFISIFHVLNATKYQSLYFFNHLFLIIKSLKISINPCAYRNDFKVSVSPEFTVKEI